MQVKSKTVHELLSHLRVYFIESDFTRKFANEELPLRSELFNADQLEHHGKYLAHTHKTKKERVPDRLLKRLDANDKILLEVRNLLTDAIKDGHMITPAGEWLLDNYYLIEEQIRIGKRHLPKGYSESLPSLANGPSASLPRVYDLALEIISHSDGRIDMESLSGFIKAYQSVTPLQLGELWAIPIMLRLALLENMRRVSVRIAIDRINQNLADYWARQMMETVEKDAKSLILVVADMARSNPPMESSFVAELTRQLLWKGPSLSLPLTWMEQLLSEKGLTSNELVFAENQKQAADQVSVSNSIGSLRFLGATDWADFVEEHSIVEQTLKQEADAIYASMDFATRDNYRHAIERISKYSQHSEKEVTDIVIKLARDNAANAIGSDRKNHVGYYLIGKGLRETEKMANMQCPASDKVRYSIHHRPLLYYLGSISLISLVIGSIMFANAYTRGMHLWLLVILAFLFILSASQLAIALTNWLTTLLIPPAHLPRMNFAKGIPSAFRSMVVVPSMLANENEVKSLAESLEVRFLANRDANLHFALLTDFPDAHQETLPSDESLIQLAKTCIEELNTKYGRENNIFFLFHRPRVWSKHDRIWMGHERKRGKLADLNALLRGHASDKFSLIVGDYQSLGPVKYIITLDTDTQLPRDAAWKLVGTMAHPLNQPYYNEKKLRVTDGYGILQPRVSVSMPNAGSSLYTRMHASEPGIDPYTRLTSDVYQDLFKEGSFIGKGIYDIDAFELAVKDMFPKNRILSHDLLEGCFARSGLLTDVQFYEEYPSRYSVDINRRHRWVRGDWQIASWALPWCPRADRHIHKNPLSRLSRWKIFDNIRRSLIPIAFTVLLLLGWTILPHPIFWTSAVVIIILLPSVVSSLWAALHQPSEMRLRQHLLLSFTRLSENILFNAYTIVCLPYEAFKNLDAIARTNWRMLISNRKLLQWTPSGMLKFSNDASIYLSYRSMWFAPSISLVAFVYISMYHPLRLVVAAPVLISWIISPFIAWWLSKPQQKRLADITEDQHIFLEKIARKTWAFFQTFVNAEENWLPPDNFQEQPVPVIAHRTSPTNIGLALLANLSAYDFGYIQAQQFIERTTGTINTLQRMERYRGHFYNWYDTLTLQPLLPLYISSVDSGNLAGHLLTLRQGIAQLSHQKILSPRLFSGIRDTFRVLEDYVPENDLLQEMSADINTFCETPVLNLSTAKNYLDKLISSSEKIVASMGLVDDEGSWWAQELDAQCRNMLNDLLHIAPWLQLRDTPPKFAIITDVRIVSLHELLGTCTYMLKIISNGTNEDHTEAEAKWLDEFRSAIVKGINNINERIHALEKLADICDELADMDYSFLYDRSKHLLTIGYNVTEHIRDSSYYDLLASEARLCTFVAISQGKLPQESWFALGRLLT
ncbi:MAG: cyclic beta 1-2 glucan synthetase, partial [Bacteroidetes bacterium]|nr:cyclic beta 1-2 glucan synthetase [Bacteroidota bacterium]